MPAMAGMDATQPSFAAVVVMWWLMMAAMMLPSASPAVLLYARVRSMRGDETIARTWIFLAGYLAVWLLFSFAAASAQRLLTAPAMALDNRFAEAAVLIAVGLYQISRLKSACLRQCRSPAEFISSHWRPGPLGAVRLGILHGVVCVGCCWMLMGLLFVGGVMSLWWIVGLTVLVGVEKLVPRGDRIGRGAGVALIGWGAARLLG